RFVHNFIHVKPVKDGSVPCNIQSNNDNFVLLVIDQPGKENFDPQAAEPSSCQSSDSRAVEHTGASTTVPTPTMHPLPETHRKTTAQAVEPSIYEALSLLLLCSPGLKTLHCVLEPSLPTPMLLVINNR
ncbi:hypothetical protein HispidOSU_030930, partial [Sigmodon hispidus]